MAKDYADPVALLEYDPAGVVIRATGNVNVLNQLGSFANSLKYYVDMMKGNAQNQHHQQQQAPGPSNSRDTRGGVPDVVSSIAAVARPQRTQDAPDKDDNKEEEEDDDDSSDSSSSSSSSSSCSDSSDDEEEESQVGSKKRKWKQDGKDDDSEEEEDESCKKRRAKEPGGKLLQSNTTVEINAQKDPPTEDKKRGAKFFKTEPDLLTKLKESQLRHSVGLTRTVISSHYKDLGLSSPSSPVHMSVSMPPKGRGNGRPSHLTFQESNIDFPFDTQQNFSWRPKEGIYCLQLAEQLDPDKHVQKELPVFLSSGRGTINRAKVNPHLLHYVGHYQCIRFEKNHHIFQNVPRQAILEFKFVGYHNALESKMAELAGGCQREKQKVPSKNP